MGFVPFCCAAGLKDLRTVPEFGLSLLEGGNQARIPLKSFHCQLQAAVVTPGGNQ